MRETICFRVLPLHLQCFRCAGAQHSCSLQEFQCFDSSSHKPQTATQQHKETSRAPRFEPYGNMWLWIYLKVKWHEQSPSPCRVVNSSRSYLEKVFPVHAAGCRGTCWPTEHLSKGLFCVALQVFTCIADFTRLLEHKDTAICAHSCFLLSQATQSGYWEGSKQSLWQQWNLSSTFSCMRTLLLSPATWREEVAVRWGAVLSAQ